MNSTAAVDANTKAPPTLVQKLIRVFLLPFASFVAAIVIVAVPGLFGVSITSTATIYMIIIALLQISVAALIYYGVKKLNRPMQWKEYLSITGFVFGGISVWLLIWTNILVLHTIMDGSQALPGLVEWWKSLSQVSSESGLPLKADDRLVWDAIVRSTLVAWILGTVFAFVKHFTVDMDTIAALKAIGEWVDQGGFVQQVLASLATTKILDVWTGAWG